MFLYFNIDSFFALYLFLSFGLARLLVLQSYY